MKIFLPLLVVGFILSACTSESPKIKGVGSVVPNAIKSILKKKDKTPAINPLAGVTRAQLKDISGPLLFANLEQINAFASLRLIGENEGVQTFITADKISLSLRNGVVLATRGLGGDLISADVSQTEVAIRKKGAVKYTRTMRWLDGQDVTQTSVFVCTMTNEGPETIKILGTSYSTSRLKEKCLSGGERFENDYWRGTSKPFVWQSRQWLGKDAGYIALQVLSE